MSDLESQPVLFIPDVHLNNLQRAGQVSSTVSMCVYWAYCLERVSREMHNMNIMIESCTLNVILRSLKFVHVMQKQLGWHNCMASIQLKESMEQLCGFRPLKHFFLLFLVQVFSFGVEEMESEG